MPAIDRIALQEIRQLREAQKGNGVAFRALIEPHLPGIWSIVRGWTGDDTEATERVVAFRDALRQRIRGFAHDRAFGLQLYGALWKFLAHDLELHTASSITDVYPRPDRPLRPASDDDVRVIQQTVAMAEPLPRLVYLFWVVTDLDAPRLAEMIGLPEAAVRAARASMVARLQEALAR